MRNNRLQRRIWTSLRDGFLQLHISSTTSKRGCFRRERWSQTLLTSEKGLYEVDLYLIPHVWLGAFIVVSSFSSVTINTVTSINIVTTMSCYPSIKWYVDCTMFFLSGLSAELCHFLLIFACWLLCTLSVVGFYVNV